MIRQYEIKVYGRVQGVGFRYAARNQARILGLKGWVENRPDGSVYAVVQGHPEKCMAFFQWCREGPGYGWVESVDISEKDPETLQGFTVKY
ncbi:MAG: acylphosphatase [Bacteroidota bacterium]